MCIKSLCATGLSTEGDARQWRGMATGAGGLRWRRYPNREERGGAWTRLMREEGVLAVLVTVVWDMPKSVPEVQGVWTISIVSIGLGELLVMLCLAAVPSGAPSLRY